MYKRQDYLDTPEGVQDLIDKLSEFCANNRQKFDKILLPPVLGFVNYSDAVKKLKSDLGCAVGEVTVSYTHLEDKSRHGKVPGRVLYPENNGNFVKRTGNRNGRDMQKPAGFCFDQRTEQRQDSGGVSGWKGMNWLLSVGDRPDWPPPCLQESMGWRRCV